MKTALSGRPAKRRWLRDDIERHGERLARSLHVKGVRVVVSGKLLLLDGAAPSYQAKKLVGVEVARRAGGLRLVNRLRVTPHHRQQEWVRRLVLPATNQSRSVARYKQAV